MRLLPSNAAEYYKREHGIDLPDKKNRLLLPKCSKMPAYNKRFCAMAGVTPLNILCELER